MNNALVDMVERVQRRPPTFTVLRRGSRLSTKLAAGYCCHGVRPCKGRTQLWTPLSITNVVMIILKVD